MKSMANNELELWWASLSVAQKERIARKGLTKAAGGQPVDEALVRYPACTVWWENLDEARKDSIHNHCVDRHAYLMKDWDDANPYGD